MVGKGRGPRLDDVAPRLGLGPLQRERDTARQKLGLSPAGRRRLSALPKGQHAARSRALFGPRQQPRHPKPDELDDCGGLCPRWVAVARVGRRKAGAGSGGRPAFGTGDRARWGSTIAGLGRRLIQRLDLPGRALPLHAQQQIAAPHHFDRVVHHLVGEAVAEALDKTLLCDRAATLLRP